MRVPFNTRSVPKDATGNGTNVPLYKSLHSPVSGAPVAPASAPPPPSPSPPPSSLTPPEQTPASPTDSVVSVLALLLSVPSVTLGGIVEVSVSDGVAGAEFFVAPAVETGADRSPTVWSAAAFCCCCCGCCEEECEGLFFWLASHAGRSMVTFRRSVRALCTYCSVTYTEICAAVGRTGWSTHGFSEPSANSTTRQKERGFSFKGVIASTYGIIQRSCKSKNQLKTVPDNHKHAFL